jgi:hypothetical protein
MDVSINIYREMEPFYHGLQRLIYLQVAEGQKRKLFAGPSLPSLSEPGSICLLQHYPDSRRLATPTKQPQSIPQRFSLRHASLQSRIDSLSIVCMPPDCKECRPSAHSHRIRPTTVDNGADASRATMSHSSSRVFLMHWHL